VQALLIDSLVAEEQQREGFEDVEKQGGVELKVEGKNVEEMYRMLMEVDPQMAQKLHPHDERKIRRALEVYEETGIPYTEVIRRQAEEGMGTFSIENLRFDSLVLCTHLEKGKLREQVERRSIQMMKEGLLDEIRKFHERIGSPDSFTNKGLLQSIGYKEFLPHLKETGDGDQQTVEKVHATCALLLSQRTMRYANKQLNWIEHQFVNRGLAVIKVDTNHKDYATSAVQVVRDFLSDRFCASDMSFTSLPPGLSLWSSQYAKSRPDSILQWKKYVCDICNGKVSNGEREWQQHLSSRFHRKNQRNKDRLSDPTKFQQILAAKRARTEPAAVSGEASSELGPG
jgi:tRNA dimethylallyltransferase